MCLDPSLHVIGMNKEYVSYYLFYREFIPCDVETMLGHLSL